MPIFLNLYFIKSPFSPYWWRLRLVVNDYCLRFPTNGGGQSDYCRVRFCDDPALEFRQYNRFPQASDFFRDVLQYSIFCFFSAVFIQVLNPMNIAYRKREADKVLATRPRCVPTELVMSRSSW